MGNLACFDNEVSMRNPTESTDPELQLDAINRLPAQLAINLLFEFSTL